MVYFLKNKTLMFNTLKKIGLFFLLLTAPVIAYGFPVVVSTASQSVLMLGALLLGAGGAASSRKLRATCLILLLIIGYQVYQQQVSVEALRMSQEHEYFLPEADTFAPVPFVSFDDLMSEHRANPDLKLIHLSNETP